MEYPILNLIFEYCCDSSDFKRPMVETEREFKKKYIQPLFESNEEEAFQMEEMFHAALSDYSKQKFIHGFQACMHLLEECF